MRKDPFFYFLFGLTFILCAMGFIRICSMNWIELLDVYADDSFYYLQIGWVAAREQLISFDGITTTTGFHPAWQFVVYVLSLISKSKLDLLFLVRVFEVFLHFLIAFVVSRHTKGEAQTKLIAFACVLSSLSLQFIGHMGMESILYILFLVIGLGHLQKRIGPNEDESKSQVVEWLVGIVSGFCIVLARIDGILLLSLLLVVMVLLDRMGSRRIRLASFLPIMAGATIALICWVLFCQLYNGYFLMDSVVSKSVFARHDFQDKSILMRLFTAVKVALKIGLAQPWLFSLLPIIAISLASIRWKASIAGVRELLRFDVSKPSRHFLISSMAANFILFLFIGFTNTHVQPWYVASGVGLAFACLPSLVGQLSAPQLKWCMGVCVTLACIFAYRPIFVFPHQKDAVPRGVESCELLPEGSRIGYFDAGATGFFTRGRTIVNLDGLVNSAVRKSFQNKTYDQIPELLSLDYIGQTPSPMFMELGASKFIGRPVTLPNGIAVSKCR